MMALDTLPARALVAAGSIALAAAGVLADGAITDLAPENSILVMSVPDVTTARSHLEQTGYWGLWQSETVQSMLEEGLEEMRAGFDEAAAELGVDSLELPTGTVGMALFPVMNEELGLPGPGYLLTADFGPHAEQTATMITKLLERAADEGATVEEQEIAGRTVHTIVPPEPEEIEVESDEFGEEDFDFGAPDTDAMLDSMSTSYLARDGSRFILTSSIDAISGAFDALDGKGGPSLNDREDVQDMMNKLGEQDAWTLVMTRDLGTMVAAFDPMGMTMMIKPMLQQVIGTVGGVAMGGRLAGETAMGEQTVVVYMPDGPAGLTRLFGEVAGRGELPQFVGGDAISYSQFNYQLGGIAEALRPILAMAPMFMGGGEMPDIEGMITQFTSSLGDEIHVVQTLERPITATSMRQVIAIRCTEPQKLEGLIAELGAGMGIEGRDFAGHRIFGMDPEIAGMMMPPGGMGGMEVPEPPVAGIGGGWFFLGPNASVESALRTLGDRGAASLSDESPYRRAVATLSDSGVVAWGYADMISGIEAQMKIVEQQMAEMQEMMNAMGEMEGEGNGDLVEMDIEEMMGPAGMFMKAFDADLLRKHLGPTAWEIRAVDDGFVMKSYQLSAE